MPSELAQDSQATGNANPTSWSDVLMNGVSGFIDSQIARNYQANDPTYNTAGGRAGRGQLTAGTVVNVGNPVIWIGIAGAVLLLFLLRKR